MRHVLISLAAVVALSGCISAEMQAAFDKQLALIERREEAIAMEERRIAEAQASGSMTTEQAQALQKELDAARAALASELAKAREGLAAAKSEAAKAGVAEVAGAIEVAAPTFGSVAGTFWPFAPFAAALAAAVAGSIRRSMTPAPKPTPA